MKIHIKQDEAHAILKLIEKTDVKEGDAEHAIVLQTIELKLRAALERIPYLALPA